jgi:hypothetical protein
VVDEGKAREPADRPPDPPPTRSHRTAANLAVLGFSLSLGSGTLVLPLLALAAGYDAAVVGLMTSVSAIAHLGLRLQLPLLLGRVADRSLIALSCLMIGGSYGGLLFSTALPVFVVAQLLQGGARALFWTASQTHAVRDGGSTVTSLARVQMIGNLGMIAGPPLAGVAAAVEIQLGLVVGLVSGLAAAATTVGMRRLAPFDRTPRGDQPHVWRRPGVDLGCWAGFTAGGWRAMLGSYVPVVLSGAGLGSSIIGVLIGVADAASIAITAVLLRWTPSRARESIEIGVVATCIALAVLPIVAGQPAAAAAVIIAGGLGTGILTTIGPALASDAVAANERGDAIAATGTFRAGGILITPVTVAAGLTIVSLPVGMAAAAASLAVPALASGLRARRLSIAGGPA